MSNLQKAKEIEQLRYSQILNRLLSEEQKRITQIDSQMASRGAYHSGARLAAHWDVRGERLRQTIDEQIRLRRELIRTCSELGSDRELDGLLGNLNEQIEAFERAPLQHADAGERGISTVIPSIQQTSWAMKAHAKTEVEILKRECAMDMHKPDEKPTAISVTTGAPTIVNLGTIRGNVQQVIGNVQEHGQTELADALKKLADAITASEKLGDSRAEYLEQVRYIAEQATVEADKRHSTIVKGVLTGLRASLQHVSEVASILSLTGPAIAHYFNFHWPF